MKESTVYLFAASLQFLKLKIGGWIPNPNPYTLAALRASLCMHTKNVIKYAVKMQKIVETSCVCRGFLAF